jgi:type I restriction enzyme S subunit
MNSAVIIEGKEAPPKAWEWSSVGTHYDFKNGLNKAKEYFGYGTPIINYMDVYANARLRSRDVAGKVSVTSDEIRSFSVQKGDAFFTRTSETVSEIGYSSVLVDDIDEAVFSGFVLRGRQKTKNLIPEFAAFALRSKIVRDQIEALATYTTRALTNGGSLSKATFLLPPEPEQKAIAQALMDMDELIASLDALIAKKRDIKQGAMQQLLTGKTRLPGFSEEWKKIAFGQIGRCFGGLTGKTKTDFDGGQARFVTFNNVMQNTVVDKSVFAHVNVAKGEQQNSLEYNDLLLNGSSETPQDLGLGSAFLERNREVFLNSFCIGFRAFDASKFLAKYWAYYLRSNDSRIIFKNLAQGSTRYNLSKAQFLKLQVLSPKLEEQYAICENLDALEYEIKVLMQKRSKLLNMREGMVQQLLTGKIRLV